MPKPVAAPPFPNSPGAWLACFRHRLRAGGGGPISPEWFGRLVGCSGATIRRWEADRSGPGEKQIARITEACCLTPLQSAFLSYAMSRTRTAPPPPGREFKAYMEKLVGACSNPVIVYDSLLFNRVWSSYVDALSDRTDAALARNDHPLSIMLRYRSPDGGQPETDEAIRGVVRLFWMVTSLLSYRPEYAQLLGTLAQDSFFSELWLELASADTNAVVEPVSFTSSLAGNGARFSVYQRTLIFPPTYYVYEFMPDNDAARGRLERVRQLGPPQACFGRALHWAKSPDSPWPAY